MDSAKLGVAESAPVMEAIGREFEAGRFEAPVVAARCAPKRAREAYEAVAEGKSGRVAMELP